MSEEKQERPDDYVIFRVGGFDHFRNRGALPQLSVLWYVAVIASGLGLVLLHVVIRPQAFEPSPWLVVFGSWLLVIGGMAFVAALAVGALPHEGGRQDNPESPSGR